MSHTLDTSAAKHTRPNYLVVFIVLGVVTALEVGVTYVPAIPQIPVLAFLMTLKVVLVAMYYMHLKMDSPWYTALILSPAPFVALIIAALVVSR